MNKQTNKRNGSVAPDNAAIIAGKIAILETWTQHKGALRGSKQYVEALRARIGRLVVSYNSATSPTDFAPTVNGSWIEVSAFGRGVTPIGWEVA